MKINFKIAVAVLGLVALAPSCSKRLELRPQTQFDESNVFLTPGRAQLALYGVYDAAQSGFYDPLNGTAIQVRGYPFGSASIQQSEMRGEDAINVAQFYQFTYTGTQTTASPNNVNMWSATYALINKANLAIEGFRTAGSSNVLTAAVAAQYEAECRFLRALAHHELLLHFARPYADGNGNKLGVPYRDFPVNSTAALEKVKTLPRESVASNYAKILADLDFAESNLAASLGTESTIRATKAAAIALKMRVKLHMQDWAGVIAEGNKLIPATLSTVANPANWTGVQSLIGPWGLTDVNTPWTNNNSADNVFSIRNDVNDNPNTNGSLPRMFQSVTAGARGLIAISPILWNQTGWRCDDTRRTLAASGSNNINLQSWFSLKYKDIVGQGDYAPIIRFAEVVLMQAEAEARNAGGVSQRAIDLLNAVRNRALPSPATNQYTAASFASRNALISAILLERRIEFLAEGKRWADIHRLAVDPVFGTGGVPAKLSSGFSGLSNYSCASGNFPATGVEAIPYNNFRFLWPIPLDEVTQNPVIEQNPNY